MTARRTGRPPTSSLPVEASIPALRRALAEVGHAVLQAPPGAGKTTVVPLRLLDEEWLADQRIVVLEPRRVATRAAARRMAHLLGEEVGQTVGYRTGDDQRVRPTSRIEVITEGILTRRLQNDPSLAGVGLVIFDEVHERNLHADLALALALDGRHAFRPDLRVLAMSATVDTSRVARLLGGEGPAAPTIESQGRTYAVDVRWRPPTPTEDITEVIGATILEALAHDEGDVLVFLPGARHIRRVEQQLARGVLPSDVDVRPLFGALAAIEQDRALAPSAPGRRRVVLATDIAETSLTVAGVRVVIDSGLVRTPHYDARTGMTRLRTGTNARSSAEQRTGRAGRTATGVAYRMWSSAGHQLRLPFPVPEIASVDLTGMALELAAWGAEPEELRFLDPPPSRAMDEAATLLGELGALDGRGRITPVGRSIVELPVHPRLARMVVEAVGGGLELACTLAALLESRDIFGGRPTGRPVDLVDRVRIVNDAIEAPASTDSDSIEVVRRRRRELARRVGVKAWSGDGRSVPREAVGRLLAVAYPDRLAEARGRGRFRLRHGLGASLPPGDALADEPYLVVADVGDDARAADHRILRAAGISRLDVEQVGAGNVVEVTTVRWDPERGDVRRRTQRRLDALVLEDSDGPSPPGVATTAALVDQARATGLALLPWTEAARTLQHRVAFLRSTGDTSWPDLSTDALIATVDQWLSPQLMSATGRADVGRLDLVWVLRDLMGRDRLAELDRSAPTRLTLDNDLEVQLDYGNGPPAVAARAQALYGTTTHPTIADGRVAVVVQVLSPAGRPVQITSDLPGFWAGSWSAVRKDMAGRYPKHDWPVDPATARPSRTARGSAP